MADILPELEFGDQAFVLYRIEADEDELEIQLALDYWSPTLNSMIDLNQVVPDLNLEQQRVFCPYQANQALRKSRKPTSIKELA